MISKEALDRLERELKEKGIPEPLVERAKNFAEAYHSRVSDFFFSEVPEDVRPIYAKLLEDNAVLMAKNWALGMYKFVIGKVSHFLEK